MRRGFDPWVEKIPWRRAWQRTPVFLARESPWTEEPDGLQSVGSQRVRHDRSNLAHTHVDVLSFGTGGFIDTVGASPVSLLVKNLPAVQETLV